MIIKDGVIVGAVSEKEVLKCVIASKAYFKKHFKDAMDVKDALVQISILESKIISDDKYEDEKFMILDIYGLIKNKTLNTKIRHLRTALCIYEYIYNIKLESIKTIDPYRDTNTWGISEGDVLNMTINHRCFETDSKFISGLTKNINKNLSERNNKRNKTL